jgi:hypothetical protein
MFPPGPPMYSSSNQWFVLIFFAWNAWMNCRIYVYSVEQIININIR